MDVDRRRAAADAFWRDDDLIADHAQAVGLIARQIKFRPRSVATLPLDRRARHLAAQKELPDTLAGRILITYHLAAQRPMMGAFLDRLGISHDNGLIADESPTIPDASALQAAARALASEFPAQDVALYLGTLLGQDPDTWGGLAGVPELLPPSIEG